MHVFFNIFALISFGFILEVLLEHFWAALIKNYYEVTHY